MLTWPRKDPNEVLDYDVLWGERLDAGETILTSLFSVVEGDVVIDSSTITGEVTTAWLSGGTADTSCVILNRITTSAGRTYDQSMRLRIKSN